MTYEEVQNITGEVKKIPYPNLIYVERSNNYANLLLEDFAGEKGEFTAISQYIYEHINSNNDTIQKTMKAIAIDEMGHLDKIGDLIKRLGGRAVYTNNIGKPWNAENVKYEFRTIREMMEFNIKSEQAAIEGYQKAISYTRNRSIRALLERIILDEQTHIKIFKGFL